MRSAEFFPRSGFSPPLSRLPASFRRRLRGSAPLRAVHREDARAARDEAAADDEAPDRLAGLGIVRQGRFGHPLDKLKLPRLLAGFLRDCFVEVGGHAPTIAAEVRRRANKFAAGEAFIVHGNEAVLTCR